ncbi:MAG: hypothetical protein V7707_01310 [Motiliproteus sp.]
MIGYVEIIELDDAKYVRYIVPNTHDPEVIQPLRIRVRAALNEASTTKLLMDFRDVDVPSFKLLDIDTLGRTLKKDIPECSRLVLLCQDSTLEHHFQNIISCSKGIDVAQFTNRSGAEAWLCGSASV